MNIVTSILDPCDYSEYYIKFSPQNQVNNIIRTEYLYLDMVEQIELSFWMIQGSDSFLKEQLCSIMIIGNIPLMIPLYQLKPKFDFHEELFKITFGVNDAKSKLETNTVFSCSSIDFCVDLINKKLISISWPYQYISNFPLTNLQQIGMNLNKNF